MESEAYPGKDGKRPGGGGGGGVAQTNAQNFRGVKVMYV